MFGRLCSVALWTALTLFLYAGCASPRASQLATPERPPPRRCAAIDIDLRGPHTGLDPVLYLWLADLEGRVPDEAADGCLGPDELERLARLGLTDPAGVQFARDQDAWVLDRWRSIPRDVLAPLLDARAQARSGAFDESRSQLELIRLAAVDLPERRLLLEELVWLSLFEGDDQRLERDQIRLAELAPDAPLARFARAFLAWRRGQLPDARSASTGLRDDPTTPPWLRLLAGDLAEQVAEIDVTVPDDPFLLPGGFGRRELTAWVRHQNLRVLDSLDDLDPLLEGVNVRDFRALKRRLARLVRRGELQPSELPWIVHLLFNDPDRMRYVMNLKTVPLEVAFRRGEYDCSEYTDAAQELLEAAGLETGRLLYEAGSGYRHILLVYEVDDRWGFMSVRSFSPPVYERVGDTWEYWLPYAVPDTLRYTIK